MVLHVVQAGDAPQQDRAVAGQRGDAPQAAALTAGLSPKWLPADAAYASAAIHSAAEAAGSWICVKPNPARRDPPPYDPERYRNRNVVERFFRHLKEFRRIAIPSKKKATNFLGTADLAASVMNADAHTL